MIGAAVALLVMAFDGVVSRFEDALLVFASVVYFVVLVRASRRENEAVRAEFAEEVGPATVSAPRRIPPGLWNAGPLVAGIALTILGADLLVAGAVDIARAFGVSEMIIGLTVIAIGTSGPALLRRLACLHGRGALAGHLTGARRPIGAGPAAPATPGVGQQRR